MGAYRDVGKLAVDSFHGATSWLRPYLTMAALKRGLTSPWVLRGVPITLAFAVVGVVVALSLIEYSPLLAAGAVLVGTCLGMGASWLACKGTVTRLRRRLPPRFVLSRTARNAIHIRETRDGRKLDSLDLTHVSLCGCSLVGGADLRRGRVEPGRLGHVPGLCLLCRDDYDELCQPFTGWDINV